MCCTTCTVIIVIIHCKIVSSTYSTFQCVLFPTVLCPLEGVRHPCAQVAVSSIGNLGLEENKRISKALSEFLESALGLKPDR